MCKLIAITYHKIIKRILRFKIRINIFYYFIILFFKCLNFFHRLYDRLDILALTIITFSHTLCAIVIILGHISDSTVINTLGFQYFKNLLITKYLSIGVY